MSAPCLTIMHLSLSHIYARTHIQSGLSTPHQPYRNKVSLVKYHVAILIRIWYATLELLEYSPIFRKLPKLTQRKNGRLKRRVHTYSGSSFILCASNFSKKTTQPRVCFELFATAVPTGHQLCTLPQSNIALHIFQVCMAFSSLECCV